jgi:hypothetical protein
LYKFQFPDTALVSNELLAYNINEMAYQTLEQSEPKQDTSNSIKVPLDPSLARIIPLRYESDGRKVYNLSHIPDAGQFTRSQDPILLVAGRVELNEFDYVTKFYELRNDALIPIRNAPELPIQDPFMTIVQSNGKKELIVGGVTVIPNKSRIDSEYFTQLYRGSDIFSLEPFARSQDKGKGLRIAQDPRTGDMVMFVRFQGPTRGELGEIGALEICGPDSISPQMCLAASTIDDLRKNNQWAGTNDVKLIDGGNKILALMHKARFEHRRGVPNNRRYNTVLAILDRSFKVLAEGTIVTREMLPPDLRADRPDLEEVTYPGTFDITGPNTIRATVSGLDKYSFAAHINIRPFLLKAGVQSL